MRVRSTDYWARGVRFSSHPYTGRYTHTHTYTYTYTGPNRNAYRAPRAL